MNLRTQHVRFAALLSTITLSLIAFRAPASVHAAVIPLSVEQEQVFVIPAPFRHEFQVVLVATVNNSSGATQDVELSVPIGYQGLKVQGVSPKSVRSGTDHIVLPAFLKGKETRNITYSFFIALDGQQGVQFTHHSFYPVYAAHLFLPIGNAALSAEGLLTTTQTVDVSGTKFREFSRLGIPAGDDWTISLQLLPSVTPDESIRGLPIIGRQNSDSANAWGAVLNLLLAAFVLVIGLLSIRSTQRGSSRMSVKKHLQSDEALLQALATLDDQYQSGNMSDETYHQRRTEVKRKLVEVRVSRVRSTTSNAYGSSKE